VDAFLNRRHGGVWHWTGSPVATSEVGRWRCSCRRWASSVDEGDSLLLSCGLPEPFGRWAFCVQCLYVERFAFSVGRLDSEGDASPCEGKMNGETSRALQRTRLPTSNPRGEEGWSDFSPSLSRLSGPISEGAAHGERSARLRLTVGRQQKRNVLRGVGFTQSVT